MSVRLFEKHVWESMYGLEKLYELKTVTLLMLD